MSTQVNIYDTVTFWSNIIILIKIFISCSKIRGEKLINWRKINNNFLQYKISLNIKFQRCNVIVVRQLKKLSITYVQINSSFFCGYICRLWKTPTWCLLPFKVSKITICVMKIFNFCFRHQASEKFKCQMFILINIMSPRKILKIPIWEEFLTKRYIKRSRTSPVLGFHECSFGNRFSNELD